jgi:hypothetical protein
MLKLDINLIPSKQFNIAGLVLLVTSSIIVLTLSFVWWVKILLIITLFYYCLSIVSVYGLLRHPDSIIRICLSKDGWMVADNRRVYAAELCGSSTITKAICVLRFKILGEAGKRSCIILRDSVVDMAYHNKIRYYLRLI